jgi:CubicO group peptidase (beta-lactamase class C family)
MKTQISISSRLALTVAGFAFLYLFMSNLVVAQDSNKVDSLAARVDKVFAQWDKPNSPGCALAVIKDDQIIYKRGYGQADLDHDIAITPTSVFHVASVSKQFTAMAIHLLAKQGKLSLDDEVKKYLPEMPDFGYPITIRHLLHHTSGLRDQWDLLIMAGWRLSEDVVKEEDILELVSRQKALNFKPGDQFLYCNTGYTLLGVIVKRVSGKSLREFTDAQIFKPLGMNSTFFRDDHLVVVKNQAYGYSSAGEHLFKLSVPNYDTVGASSLLTTVEDLARWDQNFSDYRVGGKEVIEQMQQTTRLNRGESFSYAHGLVLGNYKGLKVVEHGGADAGYRANFMRFPEQRLSIVCLCNLTINPGQLSRQVADLYLADQLKANPAAPPPIGLPQVALTEAQLKPLAGAYWRDMTEDFAKISFTDGKLYLALPGLRAELVPLSENRFQMKGQAAEITFQAAANNQAAQLLIGPPGGAAKPIVYQAVEADEVTAAKLPEYVGDYYSDEIDTTYRIEVKDDQLVLKRKKYGPILLSPIFKDAFNNLAVGTIRFTRDGQKRLNGFLFSGGRVKNFRFVKSK